MNELDTLVQQAQAQFAQCATAAELENTKAQFLGKSGRISELMKGLSQLDLEAKKSQGAVINAAKQAIEHALNARRQALAGRRRCKRPRREAPTPGAKQTPMRQSGRKARPPQSRVPA